MFYLKVFLNFILIILFHKDEYNFKSKNFNPIRVLFIMFLVICTGGFFYLIVKMVHIYQVISTACPEALT